MTINSLITQLEVDPSPMAAGFARGLSSINSYAQTVARILNTPRSAGTSYAEFGRQRATEMLNAMAGLFQQRSAQLTESLARGSINRAAFEAAAIENARAYNTVLLNSITTLRTQGGLTPELHNQLVSSLKAAGIEGGESFANGLTVIGSRLRSLGRDATQFGIEASLIITAPLVKGAHDAVEAAEELSHAIDHIAVSTGAVGPRLDALRGSFDRLFSTLPNSAEDIAHAIDAINIATGTTGPALDALATQALNLSRITGTSLAANVEASQRAFQAWGVGVSAQADNLDLLFRASQRTGVQVSALSESLAHFAPALQQFGLSFAESAALIGQFQRNGIDADAILTTLQTSLSKFAEKGIDGAHALQLVVDSLAHAGSDADAINLASRIFGPRQAAQIAEAVRNGSLSITRLTDDLRASSTTIDHTAAATGTYAASLADLHHATTAASSAIGETLERAFLAIEPTLAGIAGGVGDVARAFASLPPWLTTTITLLITVLAVLGPLALAFAGLARATGAVALFFGVFRNLATASTLSAVATDAGAAATGMTAAAGASGSLAAGLSLLGTVTGVGIALAAIAFAIHDLGEEGRAAQQRLDTFNATLQGLSERELLIKTDQLRDDLAARQKQIDDLRTSAGGAAESFADRFARISSGDLSGGETQSSATQRSITTGMEETQRQLDATTAAFAKAHAIFLQSSQDAKAFQDQVNGLIQSTATAVTVDPTGAIHGSLTALKNELTSFEAIKDKGTPLPLIAPGVVDAAIERLRHGIETLENASKPGLSSIFDQLSPSVVTLDRQVSALVARAQNLSTPLAQIADIRLGASLLSDLETVNTQLAALGTSSSLDAEKLRGLQKQLQSTLAAQLATNPTGSGAFAIDIDGHIRQITVDPSAGQQLLDVVAQQLETVRTSAEAAAAADLNLTTARASGDLARIALATVSVEGAYARAREAQDTFTQAVAGTHASVDQTAVALKTMLETVSRTGANQSGIANAHIGIAAIDPAEAKRVHDNFAEALERFGPVAVNIIPNEDRVAIERAATDAANAINRAQVLAIAGDTHGAAIAGLSGLDEVAQKVEQIAVQARATGNFDVGFQAMSQAAKDAGVPLTAILDYLNRIHSAAGQKLQLIDLTALAGDADKAAGLQQSFANEVARSVQDLARQALAGRVGAFEELQQALKDTGVTAAEVEQTLTALSTGNQVTRIADAFKQVTSSILGANSAIGALAAGLSDAVSAGLNLAHALETVHAQNEATRASGGTVDAVANAAQLAGPIGQAISAAVGLVKGIFGGLTKDPLEAEHNAILKQNNSALDALRVSLDRNAGTAGRLDEIIRGFDAAGAFNAVNNPSHDPAQNVFSSQEQFTAFLHSIGLTFEEVNDQLKALGITLVDSHGNLVGLNAGFEALHKELLLIATVGKDLQSQQKLLAVTASVAGGIQTPQQKLNDQVDALANTLDSQGGHLGRALEAANAAGPEQLRKFLADLLAKIKSGFFAVPGNLGELGGIKDVNELLDAIGTTADGLNALSDATNSVTDSLQNVPEIFKVNLEAFRAQDAQLPNPPFTPNPIPTPGGGLGPGGLPTSTQSLHDLLSKGFAGALGPIPSAGDAPSLHELVDGIASAFAPLTSGINAPNGALDRLTVSANDVADALDRMLNGINENGTNANAGTKTRPVVREEHYHFGAVTVQAADRSMEQAFDELKMVAQKRARAQFGNSARVLDVMSL